MKGSCSTVRQVRKMLDMVHVRSNELNCEDASTLLTQVQLAKLLTKSRLSGPLHALKKGIVSLFATDLVNS